jgi:teichuronic acid biosynthesis glycosyltransferase TuaC
MRVLVVTNMTPDPAAPARGRFVRDQVDALRREGVEVELYSFPVGSRQYPRATWAIRRLLRAGSFDLVHAHYGLAGWCALAAGARPLVVTFHGTDVRHPVVGPLSRRLAPRLDLIAGASRALFAPETGRAGLPRIAGASAILPCGADLDSFAPGSRGDARRRLRLDREGRYLLFPASPSRPVKRHDRAVQLARLVDAELLCGGGIEAGRMVDWVNAANAVLITSDNEGFGLAAVEALACDVPVLSTPVGIAPTLLRDIDGCLVESFDIARWSEVARAHLDAPDARVAGRERARWFAAEPMAERVAIAYRELLANAN